ncbi:IclR family transcriptional regulator [Bacillus sp. 1P10SD]|uniref:IclR family transcriptional regulator n=1 Tax=Bacillus sp. 1P10SD TaxID=3132265 RepID=UPI0039A62ABA
MQKPPTNKESISSLRNALKLLNLFSHEEPEMTLSQIAVKLNVGISTAHRLTSTLLDDGLLKKDSLTKNFRLGTSILAMGNTILSQYELCQVSRTIQEQLVQATGETVHLSIVKEYHVMYLQKMDCKHHVYLQSHIGKQNPIYCTSSGQVILAYQSNDFIENVIDIGLDAYTPNTITSPERLKSVLADIRLQGFAYSIEELHKGVSSIAAPIKNQSGDVIASVSIAGPSTRINPHKLPALAKLVKNAGEKISEQLLIKNIKHKKEGQR